MIIIIEWCASSLQISWGAFRTQWLPLDNAMSCAELALPFLMCPAQRCTCSTMVRLLLKMLWQIPWDSWHSQWMVKGFSGASTCSVVGHAEASSGSRILTQSSTPSKMSNNIMKSTNGSCQMTVVSWKSYKRARSPSCYQWGSWCWYCRTQGGR